METQYNAPNHPGTFKAFVEKLCYSKFQYVSGHAVNICIVLSLYTFAISESAAHPVGWWAWIGVFAAGWFVWTLAEYYIHKNMYHGTADLFVSGHEMHHRRPRDPIGIPWYFYVPLAGTIYIVLLQFLHPVYLSLSVCGFWFGYYSYTLVHHAVHNWYFKSAWFKDLRRHHNIHHARSETNIGVSVMFWDRIFRTKV